MTIELKRWDAMIQLVRIEGLAKQDERGQQLLLQMVIEGVRDYHEEALPADLDSDLPEYSFPEHLVELALTTDYRGVTNAYLASKLRENGFDAEVVGDEPDLLPCHCCRYKTLSSYEWDICPVCFWENVDIDFGDVPSPNHLSLEEAQQNFAEFGAMSREFLEHVLPDGPSRFHRVDESLDKQT